MAVEIEVTGNGVYAGAKSAIEAYSVSEESGPIEASDSSGGVGQVKFNAVEDPSRFGSVLLINDQVTLNDGDRGTTVGVISDVAGNNGFLDVTGTSLLGRLVIDKKAPPVHDTFPNVIRYYLSLGGIADNVAVDASFNGITVNARAWEGDLWTKIKELCVTYGAEITLLRGAPTIRPVRQRRALEINNASESWTVSNRNVSRYVEVNYYNSQYKVNSIVYPKNGWTEDLPIYTVNAGDFLQVNIPIDVSVESITQPDHYDTVPRGYMGPASAYSTVGADGEVLPQGFWKSSGGSVTAAIGADGKSIDVTIIAPDIGTTAALYSPFRIASKDAATGEFFSTLRIIGTGVHFDKKSVVVPTGADETLTSEDVGVTVDNYFISSESQARSLAIDVAAKWARPNRTLKVTKASINKPGETQTSYDYATFTQFSAYAGTASFADFNAAWANKTFADFNNYWYQGVQNSFDYQVFGNAAGSRVAWRRAMFRIRSVDIGPAEVSYTAEEDTTVGDFNASASGMTIGNFNTSYAGLKFADFALVPLPNVLPELDRW